MAIREHHGVVIANYGQYGTTANPGIHWPTCHMGKMAMESGNWELFPNFYQAWEQGHNPCQRCFPEEKQKA